MRTRKQEKKPAVRSGSRRKWAGASRLALFTALVCVAGCGGDGQPEGPVTRTVGKSGEADFSSIQECIGASAAGDTCLVLPGTYKETLRFGGRAIIVRSSDGPAKTIIDGRQVGTVVTFSKGEKEDTVLDGFTIQSGSATSSEGSIEHGGGIQMIAAGPTIRNCHLVGNTAQGDGGGIYCFGTGSKPVIRNVVFQGNTAGGQGGGLCALYSEPELTNCLLIANEATLGGAISARSQAKLVLNSCTIANDSPAQGWALYLKNATVETTNSIYWNSAPSGTRPVVMGLDPDQVGNTFFDLSYADLQGWPGSGVELTGGCLSSPARCATDAHGGLGMVNQDPLFVPLVQEGIEEDPRQAYYLSQTDAGQPATSACVDAGDPENDDAALRERTTRTDLQPDDNERLDLGYHYGTTSAIP
jgi:Right handed beta helix region